MQQNRTYVFIDASNIIYGCRASNWKMDFEKLYGYLTKRFEAKKVLYYAGVEKGNAKQLSFYNKMRGFGYDLVLKEVKKYWSEDGKIIRKANADVDLTFEAMLYWNEYDRAVFLTGDGDFYRLIAHVKAHKERVWVIGNTKRSARELKQLMGYQFSNLDDLKNILSLSDTKTEQIR